MILKWNFKNFWTLAENKQYKRPNINSDWDPHKKCGYIHECIRLEIGCVLWAREWHHLMITLKLLCCAHSIENVWNSFNWFNWFVIFIENGCGLQSVKYFVIENEATWKNIYVWNLLKYSWNSKLDSLNWSARVSFQIFI